MSAFPHPLQKSGEIAGLQRPFFCQRPGVLGKIMDGTQGCAVSAGRTHRRQSRPEVRFGHLPQNALPQTAGCGLHLLPDGRKLAGQLAVAAAGVGHAEGHPRREQTIRMDLLNDRLPRVGKVGKDHPAHRAGQLIQQAAGFAEVGIFGILADLCQLRSRTAAAKCVVEDDRHPHLERR